MRKVSAPNILLLATSLARGVPQVPGGGHDDDDCRADDDGHDDDDYEYTTFTTQTFTPPDIHCTLCKKLTFTTPDILHYICKKTTTEPSPDIYDTRLSPHRTSRRGVIDVTFDILSKTCFNLSISLTHSPMLLTDYYLFTRK